MGTAEHRAETRWQPPASTEDQWRRRWRSDDDEPSVGEEEGETVPGSHSETDTDEYYNRHSECDDEAVSSRRAATSVVIPANNGSNADAASTSCVTRGWGGTGKRGRSGSGSLGRAVSPSAELDHQSMPVAAAAAPMPILQPVPLAFAPPSSLPSSSVPAPSSAGTNLSGPSSSAQTVQDDAVDTVTMVVAGAASLAAKAVVAQHQPLAPPPPRRPAPAAGRQNPDGYTCPKCGIWFATHQGLGGHSVGHKHRERESTLAVPGSRNAATKPERVHVCGECGAEFDKGVQLGGHKRKHWAGAPIVPKKKPRAAVAVLDQHLPPPAGPAARVADITLALAVKADETSPAAASPAVETTTQPAARSPVAGRVRLFGVDIVPAVQKPEVRQGSPASATQSLGSTVVQQ